MKALTLWQPWAAVVASGLKRIENRPWEPPPTLYNERFAIHAGKKYDKPSAELLAKLTRPSDPAVPDMVHGAVIATARLTGIVMSADAARRIAGRDQERWFFGPVGWVLDDIVQLERPVECRGFQKLWNLKPDDEFEVIWGQP